MDEQNHQRCLSVGHTEMEPYMVGLRQSALSNQSLAGNWLRGWTQVDDSEFTSAVMEFTPNLLGINDLGGNVWEWCMDSVATDIGLMAVARGGSFAVSPHYCLHENSADPSLLKRPIDNAMVYRSSYRHFGKPEAPLKAMEVLACGETVPCGGMRIVAALAT
jgi:formylglycine-generating enzyme required for sulfatase activity